jgi:hypothetical protein
MPLCSKCHQKEATVHLTAVMDGVTEETVHFCKDCAPSSTGLPTLDPKELAALSVTGKKCEFCGREAVSGVIGASGPVYWCLDCGREHGRILGELSASERPDLMRRSKETSSFLAFCSDPELRAWSEAASQKAVEILRARKRDHDKGT